jgi:hypothetical protein
LEYLRKAFYGADPMAHSQRPSTLLAMNMNKFCALLAPALLLCCASARAEFLFKWTFKGMSYQTNGTGNVIATPVTEQTILKERAAMGGITDTSGLAIVYHIDGSYFGDTVDIINASTGATLGTSVLGYFFGDDTRQTLGRAAITNATQTEIRRVDYLYTDQNTHSMGASFTTKRFVRDINGNTHLTVEGPVQWLELPRGTNNTRIFNGTFTTGQALF